MKRKVHTRVIAMLLLIMMVVSLLPTAAFAAPTTTTAQGEGAHRFEENLALNLKPATEKVLRTTVVDDVDSSITYNSDAVPASPFVATNTGDANYYGGTHHNYAPGAADPTGNYFEYTNADCTGFEIYVAKAGDRGTYDIYIDNMEVVAATVDGYDAGYVAKFPIYKATELTRGKHTIRVQSNKKNAAATGHALDFDYLTVDEYVQSSGAYEASASASGHSPELAFDGDFRTFWRAPNGNQAQTLSVDLGAVKAFNEIVISESLTAGHDGIVSAMKIEVSADNVNWNKIAFGKVANAGAAPAYPITSQKKVYTFDRVNAQYVRLTGETANASHFVSIAELGIYNSAKITYDGAAAAPGGHALWYRTPGTNIQQHAIPIGNGYIGGMVMGDVNRERIILNDKAMWEGKYNASNDNADGPGRMDALRAAVLASTEARLAGKSAAEIATLDAAYVALFFGWAGKKEDYGFYSALGELELTFDIDKDATVTDYRRDLVLDDGIARVSYEYDGVDYQREIFTSYPAKAMVLRLTADELGKISFESSLYSPQTTKQADVVVDQENATVTITGGMTSNELRYVTQLKIIPEGGTLYNNGDGLSLVGADAATIIVANTTNYDFNYLKTEEVNKQTNTPYFRTQKEAEDDLTKIINEASKQAYTALKSAHQTDYRALYNRMTMDLDGAPPVAIPTNELLASYKTANDPALDELLFQYGRYLSISCSRPGTLMANLQGIWNPRLLSAWNGNYTQNINVQMAHWLNDVTNLSECNDSMLVNIQDQYRKGQKTADIQYNAQGWTTHVVSNIFGYTAAAPAIHCWMQPATAAWFSEQLYDRYRFTQDEKYLEEIYPMLKDAALFWVDMLIEDPIAKDGSLISYPAISSEQGTDRWDLGCLNLAPAVEQIAILQLFNDVIEVEKKLGTTDGISAAVQGKLDKLDLPKIGTEGQLKEWKYYEDNDSTMSHRHMSQLLGLYPFNTFTANQNTDLYEASKVSSLWKYKLRKVETTDLGWSLVHLSANLARIKESDKSYTLLSDSFKDGMTWDNLLGNDYGKTTRKNDSGVSLDDYDGVYVVENNLGATAVMAEMLLQSHEDGIINLLPALPTNWANGSFTGMKARGNFEVDISWKENAIRTADIRALSGGDCTLESAAFEMASVTVTDSAGSPVSFKRADNRTIRFSTQKNQEYRILVGVTSPAFINDTSESIVYTGTWASHHDGDATYLRNTYHDSVAANEAFAYTGTFSEVKWYAPTGPNMGMAEVYIDNALAETVDLYRPIAAASSAVFVSKPLPLGEHTIKVVVSADKNEKSTGNKIVLDHLSIGMVEESYKSLISVDDKDTGIAYSGVWNHKNIPDANYYQKTHTTTNTVGATISYTTAPCTQVKVIGAKSVDRAMYEVTLDGGTPVVVDGYAAGWMPGQTLYDSGLLEAKAHTLVVKVLNEKNTSSQGNNLDFDKIELINPNPVTKLEVVRQPEKMRYAYPERLDLSGLLVTVTLSDGTVMPNLTYSKLLEMGVRFSLDQGAIVTAQMNAQPVTITFGDQTATAMSLTIGENTGGSTGGGGSATTGYSITVTQTEGGKISPSAASVTKGSDQTFTITPDKGYTIADVLVDGKSVGAVNTYTFAKVDAKHTITAKFTKDAATSKPVAGFKDVHEDDWFAKAVAYVVEKDLMNGTSADAFNPNATTTRGMVVTILYRQAGSPKVESDKAIWWSDARAWAMAEGISDGTNMEKPIMREPLATMLYRYAKMTGENVSKTATLNKFTDAAKVSGWALDALQWATGNEIVNGKTGGVLDPQAGATRAETAAMLMRFCELTK